MGKNTNKKDGVSLANIISVIGLGFLGFSMFLGNYYNPTDPGNVGMSVIVALVGVAIFGVLLWFIVKAKTSEVQRKNWRIVEYITLGVYIILAVGTSFISARFFNVYFSSGSFYSDARADLDSISGKIVAMQTLEKSNLDRLTTALNNIESRRYTTTSVVDRFMEENNIMQNGEVKESYIRNFTDRQGRIIENLTYENENYKAAWDEQIEVSRNVLDDNSLFEIPNVVKQLNDLKEVVPPRLTDVSGSLKLPSWEVNASNMYEQIGNHMPYSCGITLSSVESYKKAVNEFSVVGAILTLIIFLIILFNYFMAPRSSKTEIQKGSGMSVQGLSIK